jgi:hypothetical protein
MSATTFPLLSALFAPADLSAGFAGEPFAVLRDVLALCVQMQFLRLLWFPALTHDR